MKLRTLAILAAAAAFVMKKRPSEQGQQTQSQDNTNVQAMPESTDGQESAQGITRSQGSNKRSGQAGQAQSSAETANGKEFANRVVQDIGSRSKTSRSQPANSDSALQQRLEADERHHAGTPELPQENTRLAVNGKDSVQ